MLLFTGLGNPGSKYENHRHNVGFMAVDTIVRRHNFSPERSRWQALACEGSLADTRIIAIKPQTFMNESGRAVGEAMRFFKLEPAQVLVFYDELDLAFGKVKVRSGGGAAGHNGIRSIISHIGADFTRVRIGIGHPGEKERVHGHVLGDFAKSEQQRLETLLAAIASEAPWLVRGDYPRFMSQLALLLQPQRPGTGTGPAKEIVKPARQQPQAEKQKQSDEGPMADALRALRNGDK